jgi:hypothetical protein
MFVDDAVGLQQEPQVCGAPEMIVILVATRGLGDHPKPANEGRLKTGQRS